MVPLIIDIVDDGFVVVDDDDDVGVIGVSFLR